MHEERRSRNGISLHNILILKCLHVMQEKYASPLFPYKYCASLKLLIFSKRSSITSHVFHTCYGYVLDIVTTRTTRWRSTWWVPKTSLQCKVFLLSIELLALPYQYRQWLEIWRYRKTKRRNTQKKKLVGNIIASRRTFNVY